jgi:cupredoxin-like protein
MSGRLRSVVLLFAVATLAFTACSSDKTPSGGSTNSPSGTKVAVTVQEYAVLPNPASAPAGSVTFNAENKGPTHTHEFVVVKTALTPDKLPTAADGSVSEEGAGIEAVGELEDIAVGTTKTVTFTMAAGSYVLFCNVVETVAGQTLVHYKLGMRTAFTVT